MWWPYKYWPFSMEIKLTEYIKQILIFARIDGNLKIISLNSDASEYYFNEIINQVLEKGFETIFILSASIQIH